MTDGIGQKAINGIIWMVSSFGLSKFAGFVSNVVLARLLFPDDFGAFALAGATVAAVSALGDFGTGAAVVYEQYPDPEHTNSAFWLGILSGVVQSAVVIVGAPWISQFYGQESLRDILMVFGLIPFVVALGETHHMLIAREMRFRTKAILELLPGACSAAVSVALALLGFGVWSMVWGTIIGTVVSNLSAWWLVPWRPSWHISLLQCRAVIRYSKSIFGLGFLIFLTDNIGYVLIGRLLGVAPVGLYSQAFRLATYSETAIVWPVEKVAFPTFSKLRDNQAALHAAFLKTIRYLALVSFPLLTLMIVLSRQLVLTFYGNKWEGMILPLQILCFLGMSRSVTAISKQTLLAVGRPDMAFKCYLAVLPSATLGIIAGAPFGIEGVAIAVTAFFSFGAWVLLLLTARQIELSDKKVIGAMQPGIFASLVMFAGLAIWGLLVPDAFSTLGLLNLAYSVLLGLCLFLLSLFLFSRQVLAEVLAVAVSSRRKRDDEIRATLVG